MPPSSNVFSISPGSYLSNSCGSVLLNILCLLHHSKSVASCAAVHACISVHMLIPDAW